MGALGYITAVGIYSLFISPGEERILPRVKIEKLVDLEHKIIGALVAALAVALHGSVSDSSEMLDLLYADAGTALVMVALCLFAQISARAETKSQ